MGGAAQPNIVHEFDFLLITKKNFSSHNPSFADRPEHCNFSLITLIRPGQAAVAADVCVVQWQTTYSGFKRFDR
jgi:hypothetical protein